MSRKPMPIEERVIRAREEGMQVWEIKEAFGMPMTKILALLRERAPHLVKNSLALDRSWTAIKLFKNSTSYGEIGKRLGISKATAVRAVALGQKAWDRRGEDFKRL